MELEYLKLYDALLKGLVCLEDEGYVNRRDAFIYQLMILGNKNIINDKEISLRLSFLVKQYNLTADYFDDIKKHVIADYENEIKENIGTYLTSCLLLENIYIDQEAFFNLLLNYTIYLKENYPLKYLDDNKKESLELIDIINKKSLKLVKK